MEENMKDNMMGMKDKMMGCRCPHHLIDKILGILMWVGAVLFFWTSWRNTMVWSFGPAYYAWVVVVLGLLVLVSGKICRCCGHHGMCK